MTRRERQLFAGILGFGIVLRLVLYSGYGLGDDPNFISAFFRLARTGAYDPADPYDVRFGLWIPVVQFIRLFGYNELAFIAPITVFAVLNLLLVYAIARLEWDRTAAFIAMAYLAVFPLDVLCSTLFAPDVMLTTYAFGAYWLFAVALREESGRDLRHAATAACAVLFLCGFASKPWVFFVGMMMALEALPRLRRSWRWVLLAAAETVLLLVLFCAWQWRTFGDPLHYLTIAKAFANKLPYSWSVVLEYARMLFLPNDFGGWFAGFFPHTILLLALGFATRLWRAGKWLLYSAIVVVGLSAMPSARVDGVWMTFVPHIFRYLTLASLPLCLALTAYTRELVAWRPALGWAFVGVFLAVSVAQAVQVTFPTRDAFGEERRAVAFVRERFPDERLISDAHLGSYYVFFHLQGFAYDRVIPINGEKPEGRAKEFRALREGILVTGGGRLPWYTCFPCHGWLDRFVPRRYWQLVATFDDAPRTAYRREPLRIWRISKSAMKADAWWDRHPAYATRFAAVRELARGRHPALGAEIGSRLVVAEPSHASGELPYWTGLACARAGRSRCAASLLATSLEHDLPQNLAQQALLRLGADAVQRGDYPTARQWAAAYRRRFPQDPQLDFLASDFAEAQAHVNRGEYRIARRMFERVLWEARIPPYLLQQARYYLALIAFRQHRLPAAIAYADAYHETQGDDPFSIELLYRRGEALRWSDPAAARAIFLRITSQFEQTLWGPEAKRQLAELDRQSRGG